METQRRKQILTLALPIVGGMISQNVLNLVDTAMVGSLGDNALAGVGMGSFANFMAIAFITGLSAGVQAMAARRYGEERHQETAIPLNGGLLLALGLAIPWALLLIFLAPTIFPFLMSDPAVILVGVPYLQARLIGMPAVGMNFAFRGYWNGVNLSHLYMKTLVIMHVCNIIISYILIFGKLGFPAYGATGAGIGTAISTFIGTGIYIYMALTNARDKGFLRQLPDKETLQTMLKISVPSGFQQFFFAAGMTAFFWIVGQVGTSELAASNVLVNLLLVAILPGIAFGLTAASLVGQALGRKDLEDAKAWGWDVSKVAMAVVGVLSIPALLFPELLLGIFIHEPQTLEMARWPLRIVALTITLDTLGMVLMNALLGAGDSKTVMKISIGFQWILFLPVLYWLGPVNQLLGLTGIWLAQVIYRGLQSITFAVCWKQGKWSTIKI